MDQLRRTGDGRAGGRPVLMGSEGESRSEWPPHPVTVPAFAIGKYEVTFDEWDVCVARRWLQRLPARDEGWGRGRRPVINVSWEDARAYVAWLSNMTGTAVIACRRRRSGNMRRGRTRRRATGGATTSPRRSRPTSERMSADHRGRRLPGIPWGLYDMHGNVWEWVEDCWNENYEGAPSDGSAWTSGDCIRRVLRGGSWVILPEHLRSANRDKSAPSAGATLSAFGSPGRSREARALPLEPLPLYPLGLGRSPIDFF